MVNKISKIPCLSKIHPDFHRLAKSAKSLNKKWRTMNKNYSVLMAVYGKDNPEYLRQSIESMLNQTIPPEQFVLVQDGPLTEDLYSVIDSYVKKTATFTIIRIETNLGLGNALDKGLQYCRNELVARMDADDISRPTRCEKELQLFEDNKNLSICGCNIDEFYGHQSNVRTSRVVPSEYKDILKFMKKRQPFNHPTVMYKKTKVLESGGYTLLKRKEDFDLFSRMLLNGNYALNINKSLYLYRADENNYRRRKNWVNAKSAITVYTRHYKRKGCSFIDWIIICTAELLFWLAPYSLMKLLSDKFLRKKSKYI